MSHLFKKLPARIGRGKPITQGVERRYRRVVGERQGSTFANCYSSRCEKFYSYVSRDTCPHLDVEICGVVIKALVDTGASCSALGSGGLELITKLGLPLRPFVSNVPVSTADGYEQNVSGVVELPIRLKDNLYSVQALVVESFEPGLILGVDFLKDFGLTLSFDGVRKQWVISGSNNGENRIPQLSRLQVGGIVLGNKSTRASEDSQHKLRSKDLPELQPKDSPKLQPELTSKLQPELTSKLQPELPTKLPSELSPKLSTELSPELLSKLSPELSKELSSVITSYSDLGKRALGRTNLIEHYIDTGDSTPIKQRHHSVSPYVREYLDREVDDMLRLGVIRESSSPWSSPVVMVKKKTGEYRFCFDGRALNACTKRDAYPLPLMQDILGYLGDAKVISSIDLSKAFWQIPLETSSMEKTAFTVPGRGLYEFVVMPFGLSNAAQTQQRLMDKIFGESLRPKVFTYIDDLIVVSKTFEEHVQLLREVYRRLSEAGLVVNFDKCQFCRPSLKYLGFIITPEGINTDPDKVSSMVDFPQPRNATEVKRFLGLCSWYRRFVSGFATLVAPLNALLKGRKKRQPIVWTEEASQAFSAIKKALVSAPVLATPRFDLEFTIQCDASDVGLGCVLTQQHDDGEHVIAYASRSLSKAERNYSVSERECLSLLFAIEKFRPYAEGVKFRAITDHHSLLWLRNLKDPVGRLARWSLKMAQFDFELIHRKGASHQVPDALSRAFVCSVKTEGFKSEDPWYNRKFAEVSQHPDRHPGWRVTNNELFHYKANRRVLPVDAPNWKLVVPKELRSEVLRKCHDEPTAAHFGFFKTYRRVSTDYFWNTLKSDVSRYVRECRVCGAQKVPADQRAGLMGRQKLVEFPFQLVSVDLIGPLPRSKRGFSWLIVLTDWYTKFVLVKPLRRATAQEVTEFMEREVFLMFGIPEIVMCDNGVQFVSGLFKRLMSDYGIKKCWYNAKYHPQVNFTERVNRVITTAIRSYIGNQPHYTWDEKVFHIASAIRSAVHEVTGYAPNHLVFGRDLPNSGSSYRGHPEDVIVVDNTKLKEWSQKLLALDAAKREIKSGLDKAYLRNKRHYDMRKRSYSFEVGDLVWKRNLVLSNAAMGFAAKLAPKRILCRVSVKRSSLVYELVDLDGRDQGAWHIKDLSPFLGTEVTDDV